MAEIDHQIALFEIARVWGGRYPELALLHASANGGERKAMVNSRGERFSSTGRILKRSGVMAGVSDVCLPTRHWGYGALWLEMKDARPHVKMTDEQCRFARLMELHGSGLVLAPHGVDEAWACLQWYLEGSWTGDTTIDVSVKNYPVVENVLIRTQEEVEAWLRRTGGS